MIILSYTLVSFIPPLTVSAVQQMKISTPSSASIQQQSAGTQTLQRKTTKIYKCLSCEYKTSDMRLFNTHYETCKHQNFQCKNCKKIFPNFGAMKQHMVREHNTPMDNTCAVCHINFVSEQALRKHMEINHSTNVVVTSTTTLPVSQVAAAPAADSITSSANVQGSTGATTALYTCNHCQFKSTDKGLFDEHMRKHMAGIKSKPFKCRLCAQRFETREAATTHAKQHQGNVFKCGTCSMSFPKREMLVKHFEEHHHQQPQQQQVQVQQQQQMITIKQQPSQSSQNLLTTQKLLQETIDEALSDSTTPVTTSASDVAASAANNIRFFSCHICSLTFIQENYYNQHMETHRRGDSSSVHKKSSAGGNNLSTLNAAALLSEAAQQEANEMSHHSQDLNVHHQQQQVSSMNAGAGGATISEADIESIFEKMHSDKGDNGNGVVTTTSASGSSDQVVITSQAGTGGGITFNITLPGQETAAVTTSVEDQMKNTPTTTTAPVSVSIDMPMLDQPDESTHSAASNTTPPSASSNSDLKEDSDTNKPAATGPVSMPSLDDDNEEPPANAVVTSITTDTTATLSAASEESKSKESANEQTTEETSKPPATEEDSKSETVAAEAASSSSSEHHPDTAEQQQHAPTETSANNSGENTQESVAASAGTGEENPEQQQVEATHDDGEHQTHEQQLAAAEAAASEAGGEQHVAMELDEASMQAQVDGGQIKFILNESGQLLQLDNHIITDADGNQILVQDPEQIQQLLQSVGVLQSGEGLDGETLQMMTDGNGQMVLVQGENNETQLIDASLLNSEGQLVIQQSQDGEGGAHVIGEDGTRIPVSVSYTEDGQPIVQVQQVLEATSAGSEHGMEKDGAEGIEYAQI